MESQMTVREPTARHTQTVIFLHGRDSTASDFADELFESQATDDRTFPQIFPGMKWVFPKAPLLPATRYGEAEMSQWFDMWSTENPHEREHEQKLTEQVIRIRQIIVEESNIVAAENLFLAGISQGCAIGIYTLLTQEKRLAGFIGLCGWVPYESKLRTNALPTALETPVLLGHHIGDDVIDVQYGEELRDKLTDMGMKVSWHSYSDDKQEIKHWLNEPQGVDDIAEFINRNMEPQNI